MSGFGPAAALQRDQLVPERLINLMISEHYVGRWGLKEAIRELVQNLYDAAAESARQLNGAKSDITFHPVVHADDTRSFSLQFRGIPVASLRYHSESQRLTLRNFGALPLRNILLGGGTKRDGGEDIIGRFGEGLKLAAKVLLCLGKQIRLTTNSRDWTFSLRHDATFDDHVDGELVPSERTLHVTICATHEAWVDVKETVVCVDGLTPEEWKAQIRHFTDLTDQDMEAVDGVDGDKLILGPGLRGAVFSKGIRVNDDPANRLWAYSFADRDGSLELDRDRLIVANCWALYRRQSKNLVHVMNQDRNRIRVDDVYNREADNHVETYYFHDYATQEVADQLWEVFRLRHPGEEMPTSCAHNLFQTLRQLGIGADVYPYIPVSSHLMVTLQKSQHYRTPGQRRDELMQLPEAQLSDEEEQWRDEVLAAVRRVRANVEMVPLALDAGAQVRFCIRDKVYLSGALVQAGVGAAIGVCLGLLGVPHAEWVRAYAGEEERRTTRRMQDAA